MAIALISPVLTTVTTVTSSSNSVSNGSAQARSAIAQLSSDIGSATANNVCFPASVLATPPTATCSSLSATGTTKTSGYPLVVLSDAYGSCTWFQWTVNSSQQLMQQSAAKGATSWMRTAVLVAPLANNLSQTYFNYDTTNSLINIQLVLAGSTTSALAATTGTSRQDVDLQTSVSLFTTAQSSSAGSC